jgi:hypothetical protein
MERCILKVPSFNGINFMVCCRIQQKLVTQAKQWQIAFMSLMVEIYTSCSILMILNEMCLIRHGKLERRNNLEYFNSILVVKCAIFLIFSMQSKVYKVNLPTVASEFHLTIQTSIWGQTSILCIRVPLGLKKKLI